MTVHSVVRIGLTEVGSHITLQSSARRIRTIDRYCKSHFGHAHLSYFCMVVPSLSAMVPVQNRFDRFGLRRLDERQRLSREIVVDPTELKVVSDATDLQLVGVGLNGSARFTHWSFGQLSRLAGTPVDYLRTRR